MEGNRAVSSFIKAYTTYPRELKSIFYVKGLKFHECFESFFLTKDNKSKVLKRGAVKKELRKLKNIDKGYKMKHKGSLMARNKQKIIVSNTSSTDGNNMNQRKERTGFNVSTKFNNYSEFAPT